MHTTKLLIWEYSIICKHTYHNYNLSCENDSHSIVKTLLHWQYILSIRFIVLLFSCVCLHMSWASVQRGQERVLIRSLGSQFLMLMSCPKWVLGARLFLPKIVNVFNIWAISSASMVCFREIFDCLSRFQWVIYHSYVSFHLLLYSLWINFELKSALLNI